MGRAGVLSSPAPLSRRAQEENRAKLFKAAKKGRADDVRALVNGVNLNCQDGEYGATPLLVASGKGHYDVAKYLLDAGADVDATDPFGSTALHASVLAGQLPQGKI